MGGGHVRIYLFGIDARDSREAWNKGKVAGQTAHLKPKNVWAIRIHLPNAHEVRDLVMFKLVIDSKLRGCDHVILCRRDVTHGNHHARWFFSGRHNVRFSSNWPSQRALRSQPESRKPA